jgi:hypothetical protein
MGRAIVKRLAAWFGAHPLRPAITSIALILILGAAAKFSGAPRLDRDWHHYLARTAQVDIVGSGFAISPVSDWSYAPEGVTNERYIEASYNLDELRQVWFMLEPQPGSELAAHTLLLFEFEGDRLLGLTIEARREANEDYSALHGIFNSFELAYVWGSARDLLVRRAVMLDHEVFLYPVAINDEQKRVLLTRLLQRTDELETRPRYYNTITSNCTNELAKAAGFHWAPAYILTGRSDEYLFDRGIIPGASFERANALSDVTTFVQALNQAPPAAFDAALLTELRRRWRAELSAPG